MSGYWSGRSHSGGGDRRGRTLIECTLFMLYSLILRTASRILLPLLLLFAVFIMLRGHDLPGGGFVGGLVAAGAFVLHGFVRGSEAASGRLRAASHYLVSGGLAASLGSGILALLQGKPFLTSLWFNVPLPGGGELYLGSTLLFDIGVFSVVVGTVLMMVLSLEQQDTFMEEPMEGF